MLEESKKHHWLRIAAIVLMTFIVSFLAFYLVMELMINKISDPLYSMKRIERVVQNQERKFQASEEKLMESPFEPRTRPMLVNLVNENDSYKVIVDLTQFEDEEALNVDIKDNELTVKGEFDKNMRGTEKIINFMQTYYLDEKLDEENISRERKGNKYIITIPFKD